MAEQHKYRKTKLSHFFDYSEDKFSAEDRHAFEKQLQADPFEAEAADGFNLVSRDEAFKDLASSTKKIKNRINRKNRTVWYTAAAAIASFLIIGTIFMDLSYKDLKKDEAFEEITKSMQESPNETISSLEIEENSENKDLAATNEMPVGDKKAQQNKNATQVSGKGDIPTEIEQIEKNAETFPEEARAQNNEGEAQRVALEEAAAGLKQEIESTEENKLKGDKSTTQGYIEDDAFAWETMSEEATEGRYNIQNNRKVIMQEAPVIQYDLTAAKAPESTSTILSGTISGVVISSADMSPVPGVSLNIKGTDIGTVTDFNGEFKLNTNNQQQGTVVARYIGMETEEFAFRSGETIEIAMIPDEISLDEVIVVGYGTSTKKEAGGAEVNMESISNNVEYISANPVTGMSAFKQYIDSTMVFPPDATTVENQVVILKFYISENGRPNTFTAIRSPGEAFSKEAVRIVEEGPDWIPASRYGQYINESVRLRIVFQR